MKIVGAVSGAINFARIHFFNIKNVELGLPGDSLWSIN